MIASALLPQDARLRALLRSIAALFFLFIFLLGVKGLGAGFRLLGDDLVQGFFVATENPFIGLVVGLLTTTLVQSSSVTTSMIVALVAAPENPLPLLNAVPMIMGANIGTTVTATIVSLAHLGRQDEFQRAFPIAICHDIFNYLTVLILLPLEMAFGTLRRTAAWLAGFLGGVRGVDYDGPLDTALSSGLDPIITVAEFFFSTEVPRALFLTIVGGLLIFFALFSLVKVLRALVSTRVESAVNGVLGGSAVVSILVGVLVTVMVQSSSITTSILVPLGAAGLLRLEQAFPVTIGANLGTTVTALLAAMAVSGQNAAAGLQIALVHLLFNFSGLFLIYPLRSIRKLPLDAARLVTRVAVRSRKLTVLWVLLLFYGLPGLCIAIFQWFR